MDREEFLKNVKDQFLDEEDITLDFGDDFRKIKSYDSLTGMAIIATLEDAYNVSLPVDDYRKLNTVDELYEYVKQKSS